ncbi:MAG: hypothetical protein M1814_006052 [Vezdaea aestivalis]|nr:MAG: hypothetical protein M1814_006052 [Vezdaea aestivalis]
MADILHELRRMGILVAAASSTAAPDLAREILDKLVLKPSDKRAISFFDSLQIIPGSKAIHVSRLRDRMKIDYSDMIFFDDEARNKNVEKELGAFTFLVRDGITVEVIEEAVGEWRRRKCMAYKAAISTRAIGVHRSYSHIYGIEKPIFVNESDTTSALSRQLIEQHCASSQIVQTLKRRQVETMKTVVPINLDHHSAMEDLLNLQDIEDVARNLLDPKAWAYYFSGSDDEISKALNSSAYRSILFRPRVFVDVTKVELSTQLTGRSVNVPFFVSPAAMATLAHPSGEQGIADACGKYGAMQIISNNASMSPEDIVKDSGPNQFFGFQLYVQVKKEKTIEMLQRINKLSDKIKFICLTLDAAASGKRERDQRESQSLSKRPSLAVNGKTEEKSEMKGGIGDHLFSGTDPGLTWEKTLPWLREHTDLPIVLKGILSHEDAMIAAEHRKYVQGIILSNHGGRSLDSNPPPIHTLLEIKKFCPEVLNQLEVWIDGGIKRGTDVVKALCLGAKGVGLGRAPLWGLGAGGVAGVERTFESKSLGFKYSP